MIFPCRSGQCIEFLAKLFALNLPPLSLPRPFMRGWMTKITFMCRSGQLHLTLAKEFLFEIDPIPMGLYSCQT